MQRIAPTPARRRLPFSRHLDRLRNGLPVVTVEMPHLHSTSIVLYAKVGSRYERARDNGLSHFLEHMLFRGTAALPDAYLLSRAIEEIGGTLYAETGRDYSLYQVSLHPDTVAEGLRLFGDIFTKPAFSEIDVERRVILEELSEDLDDKGRFVQVDDLARAAAFEGHPLAQRIIGPKTNVERFTNEDVRRFFARGYGAANTVLAVAGAARHKQVLRVATEAFSKMPVGRRMPSGPPGATHGPQLIVTRNAGSQTQVQILFRAFGERDTDYASLLLLSRVIDDGMSTRLHRRLIDELGLAYYVSGSAEHFHDTGLYEIDGAAAHENVPAFVSEAVRVLQRLCVDAPSEEELDKAKRRYRWDLESSFDDPDAMAGWWAGSELFFGPMTYEEKLERIDAVTPEAVRRTAERIFRRERMTVACVGLLSRPLVRQIEKIVENG
jgi:predicted Zn-dependent peptidase